MGAHTPLSVLRAFLTVPVPPPPGLSQTRLRFAAPGSVLPRTGVRRTSLQKTFLIRGSSCWDEDHGQPWPGRGPGTAPSPSRGFRAGEGELWGTRWGSGSRRAPPGVGRQATGQGGRYSQGTACTFLFSSSDLSKCGIGPPSQHALLDPLPPALLQARPHSGSVPRQRVPLCWQ